MFAPIFKECFQLLDCACSYIFQTIVTYMYTMYLIIRHNNNNRKHFPKSIKNEIENWRKMKYFNTVYGYEQNQTFFKIFEL